MQDESKGRYAADEGKRRLGVTNRTPVLAFAACMLNNANGLYVENANVRLLGSVLMWAVSPEQHCCVDKGLATISADSPSLLQTHEEFGLLVGLWCGRVHVAAPRVIVGLLAGELTVDVIGGRISSLSTPAKRLAGQRANQQKERAKGAVNSASTWGSGWGLKPR
jgi:hypothetical protein